MLDVKLVELDFLLKSPVEFEECCRTAVRTFRFIFWSRNWYFGNRFILFLLLRLKLFTFLLFLFSS
jgi:hypothetical protein